MIKYLVPADWMKACGFGDKAKAYPVVNQYERGGFLFVELDTGNYASKGSTWTVNHNWRKGQFIEERN